MAIYSPNSTAATKQGMFVADVTTAYQRMLAESGRQPEAEVPQPRSWGGFATAVAFGIPASVLSAVDTFGETASNLAGVAGSNFDVYNENTMEDFLNQNIPWMGQIFQENRGAYQISGDILGSLLPGMIAVKAVQQGSWLARAIDSAAPGMNASRWFSTGKSSFASAAKIKDIAYQAAKNEHAMNFVENAALSSARWKLTGQMAYDVVLESAAAAGAIYATMNSSTFLYPEEMTTMDHIKNFTIFTGLGVGATALITRYASSQAVRAGMREAGLGGRTYDSKELTRLFQTGAGSAGGLTMALHQLQWIDNHLNQPNLTQDAVKNLSTQRTVAEEFIRRTAQGLSAHVPDELIGVTTSNPGVINSNTIASLHEVAKKSPGVVTYGKSLDEFSRSNWLNMEKVMERRQNELQDTLKRQIKKKAPPEEIRATQNKLAAARNTHLMVLETDGTVTPLLYRAETFYDFTPGGKLPNLPGSATAYAGLENNAALSFIDGNLYGISNIHGLPTVPLNKLRPNTNLTTPVIDTTQLDKLKIDDWMGMSLKGRTAAWAAARDQIDSANPESILGVELIDAVTTHIESDFILEMVRRGIITAADIPMYVHAGVQKGQKIISKSASLSDVQTHSWSTKVEKMLKFLNNPKGVDGRGHALVNSLNINSDYFADFSRFIRETFKAADTEVFSDVFENADEMLAMFNAWRSSRFPPGVGNGRGPQLSLDDLMGNMLTRNPSAKPLILFSEMPRDAAMAVPQAAARLKAHADYQSLVAKLNNSQQPAVQGLMQVFNGQTTLVERMRQDMMYMTQNLGDVSDIESIVTTLGHKYRHHPAFQALMEVQNTSDKQIERMFSELIETALPTNHAPEFNGKKLREIFSVLTDPSPIRTIDRNFFFAGRDELLMGWDVEMAVATMGPNNTKTIQYQLRRTEENAKLYYQVTGQIMNIDKRSKKTYLMPDTAAWRKTDRKAPMTQFNPLTLSPVAADALDAVSTIEKMRINIANEFAIARGQTPMALRDFMARSPALEHQHKVYFADADGNVLFMRGADSKEDLQKIVTAEMANASKQNRTLVPMSEVNFADRFHVRNELHNRGLTAGRLGAVEHAGRIGGQSITGTHEVRSMIESMSADFLDLGREFRHTVFAPEVTYLQGMLRSLGERSSKQRTIYEDAIHALNGTQQLRSVPDSLVAKYLGFAESSIDYALQHVGKVRDAIWTRAFRDSPTSPEALARTLEQTYTDPAVRAFMPAQNALDFAERFIDKTAVPSLRRYGPIFNEIIAGASLRVANLARPVIEMTSLAATMPAVSKMLMPTAADFMEGQTADATKFVRSAWEARTGAFGSRLTDQQIMAFNPAKLTTSTFEKLIRRDPGLMAVLDDANRRGVLDASSIEGINIFHKTGQTKFVEKLRSVTDWLSYPGDWAEQAGRTYAFINGFRIGKELLGLEYETAMSFANRFANRSIGDFRPSSRPLIFQGAAGLPLGLFTTYVWNFWQRSIDMLETGMFKNVAGVQAALKSPGVSLLVMQGALFGAQAVPGWKEVIEPAFSNYDGSLSIQDHMLRSFGYDATEFFMSGTISQLPKLANLLPGEQNVEGVSVGPRAQVGLPFARGYGATATPLYSLMSRAWQASNDIVNNTIANDAPNPSFILDAIAAANINGGLANIIELGLTHRAVDKHYNLIEPSTWTPTGIIARSMGLKPLYADEFRQEVGRNRITEKLQGQLKDKLGNNLAAHARAGTLDPDVVQHALEKYIEAGGNPENFVAMVRRNIEKGTISRVDRDVVQAINDNDGQRRLARLLYLQAHM